MSNNIVKITAAVILYKGEILSWKANVGSLESYYLDDKYFHPIGRENTEVVIETFEGEENNDALWGRVHQWYKKWKIHSISKERIAKREMFSPYPEER